MLGLLIWLIPLIGSGVVLAFGSDRERFVKIFSIAIMLFIVFSSIQLLGSKGEITYPWIPELNLNFGILLDNWSTLFVLFISFVATIILIYSFTYIKEGIARYYSFFLLFVGSMIGFVLASNLLQILIFWELMGVCSYFLIGFYYRKDKSVKAGLKALLTTKIGDVCLFLAVLLFFLHTGSLNLSAISSIGQMNVIGILFVIAILTKSAQFPFYFWLADAMEGPTTVSALLHSATMVKAGIFLLLRVHSLLSPDVIVLLVLASGISMILSAILALTSKDIKRVLAFSTISQLAFMTLGIVLLKPSVGFLHMLNHSVFKALLFLCTGIFIHISGSRSLRRIKLAQRYVPILFVTFLIGILSLAGIPPFSGFWSKEMIFTSSLESHSFVIISVFVIGSLLTFLYSFRLLFDVFDGDEGKEHQGLMEFSIMGLAFLSLVLGVIELFVVKLHFDSFLLSLGIIGIGGLFSYVYFQRRVFSIRLPDILYDITENEFYMNRFFLYISEVGIGFTQWVYNTLERAIVGSTDVLASGILFVATSGYKTIENIIVHSVDKTISKTTTTLSNLFYKMLELDMTRMEEISIRKLSKKIHKLFKYSQTSYLNYNILAVGIGIIILSFLIIVL